MTVEVKELVVDQFSRTLGALRGILKKAQAHAAERKFDENSYLQLRLAPDMFPFVRQVQIATDVAKGAVARLSGKDAPVFADNETKLSELLERIDKTIDFIRSATKDDFKDFREKKASFPWRPGVYMMGDDYLISHAVPNFFFHVTTAYALLRGCGVALGKADYLGEQNWKSL